MKIMNKDLDEVKLKPVKTWFTDILTNPSYDCFDDKIEIGNVKADIVLADEVGVGDESMAMICESLNDDYSGPFTLDVEDLISKAEKNVREGNLSEAEKLFKEAELGSRKYPPSNPDFRSKTRKYNMYDGVYRAARALGNLGDKRAVPSLIDKLDQELPDVKTEGASTNFCRIIVEALRNIDDNRAQDVFEKALEFSSTLGWGIDLFDVGNALIKMKSGGKQSSERNAEMLLKNYNYQRLQTWEQLEMIGEPAVKPLIKAINEEGEMTPAAYAAETLGKIGDKRAIKPLVKLLKNSFPSEGDPMLYAAEALNNIAEENQHDDECEHIYEEDDGTYSFGQCDCIMSNPTNYLGQKILALLEKYNEDEMNLKAIYILARGEKSLLEKDTYSKAISKELIAMRERAIEPLIEYYSVRQAPIIEILVKITEAYIKTKEKKEILKFLKSNDMGLVMMGTSMLKGLMKE